MPNYMLRNVPAAIWDPARARADRDGWPLKALILRLMEDYAAGRITPSGQPPMGDKDASPRP